MKNKSSVIYLVFIFLLATGCTSNTRNNVSVATEGIAILMVAVPVGIYTSPYWVPKMIIDSQEKQITVKIQIGDPKYEIRNLLGEAKHTYLCEDPFYEIWEYDIESVKPKYHYLVFNKEGLLHDFASSWMYRDNCKLNNAFKKDGAAARASF